jgi:FkbM family methyltransferase
MNLLCRQNVAPFETTLGVTSDRIRFVCDLHDAIAREACFMGYYEPQETALVRHLLRPGMCFVDVGANWGYYTLLAADIVGNDGRVVALEPHPELFRCLEANVSRNGLPQVVALRVAVADSEGEMNLAGFADEAENSGISRLTEKPEAGVQNFRVRTRLLENLLDECGVDVVDLLKMDIEGGEGVVLPTMRDGLRRGRYRHLLLEVHPSALREQGLSAAELIGEILEFGYRAWQLDHSREAFRRAAYRLPKSPSEFLKQMDAESTLDAWPHLLFVAPHVRADWESD